MFYDKDLNCVLCSQHCVEFTGYMNSVREVKMEELRKLWKNEPKTVLVECANCGRNLGPLFGEK
jgi:predicted molibdopterin-dependent oxidoreductase YjgC